MMKMNMCIGLICSFLLCSAAAQDAPYETYQLDIKEWQVPWKQTRPRDPAVDSKGIVWFCGQAGNYLASLDPATGEFKQYSLPDGTYPHNLIIDADDMIWYAGNRNNHIGQLNPKDGTIKRIDMPVEQPIDPHTLVFDEQQNIWFTAQWGNKVGYFDRKTGKVDLVDMEIERSRPYGIKVNKANTPWVVLFGTNKLASIDPVSMALTTVDLPDQAERPRRLEIASNGDVYYLDYTLGYLGQYSPVTKKTQRYMVKQGSDAKLYGSAMDDKNRVFIAVTGVQPNIISVFDTNSKGFIASKEVPSGAGTIRYMYYHQPSDTVWFGTDNDTVGQVKLSTIKQP
ncbi:lyase [Thalassotalea sp. HSM 43]|uniref:Vgb family protein n=1 Tax=Thalassotalea sp. HSM 43 TaxID=2552945 RepID=UPI001080FFAB|nr:lyase [Thalassotalea sp. HSM 43]QBY05516.1 lyase [Thalassotalea sp. HSM 43]